MEPTVPSLIADAWERIRPKLLDDPHELARRLARRRKPLLMRPPRAWCIAIRASDHRLTERAFITPAQIPAQTPAQIRNPQSKIQNSPAQHLTLDTNLLKHLTDTHRLAGQFLDEASKILGTTSTGLTRARIRNTLQCKYVPGLAGRRGKPIPILSSKEFIDPNSHLFAPPDLAWAYSAHFLAHALPADFQQTLTRIPCYFDRTQQYADKSNLHPEDPRLDPVPTGRQSMRLPPPPPDYVWYKWKGDEYIGYDWRAAEKNPRIRIDYERHERRKAKQRAYAKAHPQPSRSTGSIHFRGWKWLCPHCQKTCRTLFLPVPSLPLLSGLPRLAKLVEIPRPALGQTFACFKCHNLRRFSRVDRNSWNQLIAYLTAGLLYGHEVPRPAWLTRDRKRPYAPRPTREPSLRRQQVLERLLQGLTYDQIAAELNVGFGTVHRHAKQIYQQHQVSRAGRRALARKLGITLPPPHHTHTPARRKQVKQLLQAGHTYQQIATTLGVSYHIVHHDVRHLRREQRKIPSPVPA
jgi:DNA-binding NarL/FixJ family response regulator